MSREGYPSTANRQKPSSILNRGYSTDKKYTATQNYSSTVAYMNSLSNPKGPSANSPAIYSNYLSHNARSEDRKKSEIHRVIDNLTNINVGKAGYSSAGLLEPNTQKSYVQKRQFVDLPEYPSKNPLSDLKARGAIYDTITASKIRLVDRPEDAFQSLQSFSSPEKKKTESRTYFEQEAAPAVQFEDIAKQNGLLQTLLSRLQRVDQPFSKTDYSNLKRDVFYGAVIEKETLPKAKKDEIAAKELTLEQLRKELAFLDKYQAELEQTRARYTEQLAKSSRLSGTSLAALRGNLERLESGLRPAPKQGPYK